MTIVNQFGFYPLTVHTFLYLNNFPFPFSDKHEHFVIGSLISIKASETVWSVCYEEDLAQQLAAGLG